ncbi:MAG: glycoside hydrolase family 3 protein [Anaerolineae bacterium]|nr:glycoside hydrolase family 3 protein [Anaerolineae bacterium]
MDVENLLGQMTLQEKVGQLFLLAFEKDRLDEARVLFERHFVGASYLSNDNLPSPEAAAALTAQLQGYAANTRLAVPLLLGCDQEGAWGVMARGSIPGPGNMALGATGDPDQAFRMYRVIGEEMRHAGLNTLLAPCADCNSNPHNAIIGMRSFGEKPEAVAAMTAAAVRGAHAGGVFATVKHFPGHGDTTEDSHRGIPAVRRTREALFDIDLKPFAEGIRAGADIVMTAHILFPALDPEHPATLSRAIMTDLLRGEWGFDGVILTDSMNMKAITRFYAAADAAVRALNAGVDMIMLAEEHYGHDAVRYLEHQTGLISAVVRAVEQGDLPVERLDDSVRRVLRLKAKLNAALPADAPGSAAHRAVALDVSRRAVAVLRSAPDALPLTPSVPVVLVNTTQRSAYDILTATRGIGPSQEVPAFDLFAGAVCARAEDVTVVSARSVLHNEFDAAAALAEGARLVAVTENYPLPGIDFDKSSQREVIERLLAAAGDRLIVVALRDPYELADLPNVATYVCAFSFRPQAAQAAGDVLFGVVEARGVSPVSVPDSGIHA